MAPKREMFLFPQSVVEKIITRYGYEKMGEFSFLLSQYCSFWDNNGTGEGFDFSHYSEAVLIYFDMIRCEIDEKHRQFFAQGEQMSKIAAKRWEKEAQKEKTRARKRQWYVDNSEKINQKRRKKISDNKDKEKSKMSSDVSSNCQQGQENETMAQNDAYAYKNYELMKQKNFKKNYDLGDVNFVENSGQQNNLDPSDSLTGHNLTKSSVISENHKNEKTKNHKNEDNQTKNQEAKTMDLEHNPPQPYGQLPSGEPEISKDVVRATVMRPTIYGQTWIKIGDDFEVDLFDPMFECFSRARKFLIKGFEMWCRKKLVGEVHDKWWLRDQLGRNFANRQGDVSYMTDNEQGGNNG